MKTTKKGRMMIIAGISIFIFVLGMNLQYALNGYGMSDINLHQEVLAQTNSDDSSGSSSGTLWYKSTGNCSIILEGEIGTTVTLFGISYTIPSSGRLSLTFTDVKIDCDSGGTKQCTEMTCAQFWKGSGSGT